MLILWQDRVAVEVHAVAVASAEVHSEVHTAVVSEAHTMVAHLEALIMVVLEDIIMLPHPHITTDYIFTAHSDLGVVLI